VRLIGAESEQLGVVTVLEGLRLAQQAGLDLVEVAPTAVPPVCRIMDYNKYKYEQDKKEKEAKRKQHFVHLKEIKFRPKIEEHDYHFKLDHLRKFIGRGDKVKVTLMFRGREMAHQEFGRRVIDRVVQDVTDVAQVEKPAFAEGRMISLVLTPK